MLQFFQYCVKSKFICSFFQSALVLLSLRSCKEIFCPKSTGQCALPWVTIFEVHSQARAWSSGSGLGAIGSWAIARDGRGPGGCWAEL